MLNNSLYSKTHHRWGWIVVGGWERPLSPTTYITNILTGVDYERAMMGGVAMMRCIDCFGIGLDKHDNHPAI